MRLKTLFYDLCVSVLSKILAHTLFYWLCVQVLVPFCRRFPRPFFYSLVSLRWLSLPVCPGHLLLILMTMYQDNIGCQTSPPPLYSRQCIHKNQAAYCIYCQLYRFTRSSVSGPMPRPRQPDKPIFLTEKTWHHAPGFSVRRRISPRVTSRSSGQVCTPPLFPPGTPPVQTYACLH